MLQGLTWLTEPVVARLSPQLTPVNLPLKTICGEGKLFEIHTLGNGSRRSMELHPTHLPPYTVAQRRQGTARISGM